MPDSIPATMPPSPADEARRVNLREASMDAWLNRNPVLTCAVSAFIDDLVDSAANDRYPALFRYYRALHYSMNQRELEARLETVDSWIPKSYGTDALEYICEDGFDFGTALVRFLLRERAKGNLLLPEHLYVESADALHPGWTDGAWSLETDLEVLLDSDKEAWTGPNPEQNYLARLYFILMDTRIRQLMSAEDIKSYILDFDPTAFALEGRLH